MDRVIELRQIVHNALREWTEFAPPEAGCENILLCDENSDNYAWIYTGWSGRRHVNHTVIHLGLRDGKIHVFHDGASYNGEGIVDDLLRAGVLEDEIVLEFNPPYIREKAELAPQLVL